MSKIQDRSNWSDLPRPILFVGQLATEEGRVIEAPLSADRVTVGDRVAISGVSYQAIGVEHTSEEGIHIRRVVLRALGPASEQKPRDALVKFKKGPPGTTLYPEGQEPA